MHPRLFTFPAFSVSAYWVLLGLAVLAAILFYVSRRAAQDNARSARETRWAAWIVAGSVPIGLVLLWLWPDWRVREVGPTTLHTYGVLLAIAFLAGLWVASRQAKRAGLDAGRITDMAVWVLIAGLVGAKLLLVVVDWRYFSDSPRELLSIFQSGGVFYGGLLGGILVAWWYARRYGLPGWQTADVLAPGVIIGQAIGRLGCFAAGCCWGASAQVPWAVTFTDVYSARAVGTPLDTPLHPSQLYESLAAFLIFFFLLWLAPRKRFNGQVAMAYVALYSAARFGLEFLRGDPDRGTWFQGTLSTSQLIAIVLMLGVAVLLPRVRRTQAIDKASSA